MNCFSYRGLVGNDKLNDNQAKLLAFESSTGYVSEVIERHLKELERNGTVESWEEFKTVFKRKFADVTNPTYAMSMLRAAKQLKDESVALYAEQLISLAKEAYALCRHSTDFVEW